MRPCTGSGSAITTERSRHLTQFADLGLSAPLLEMLTAEHYTTPTPIQAQAIPHVLAGRDLLGIAQTGTGKTAAFALPILHRLDAHRRRAPRRGCRVLVLAPTRELASQIERARSRTYGRGIGITSTVVFGGVGGDAAGSARWPRGVDVLVATPGRLLDHMQQGNIRLDGVEVIVLDEADRMLDMGFIAPVRRIVAAIAGQPPDAAVLGDHAGRHPQARRRACLGIRCEVDGDAAGVHCRADRSAGHPRRRRARSRRCWQRC